MNQFPGLAICYTYTMSKALKKITSYSKNHWLSILLIALSLVAILSSILALGQNIWFDEGYSIYVAQKPVAELINLVSVDAHPPLYYLILKLWGSLFGWNEFALRFLSIIFATAAVAIVFLIVKKMAGVKIALGVLPFLVLAPFALRYSYEIRPYAMTSTIVAGGTLLLLYATQGKQRFLWVWYAVMVAAGMLTLYMSALIWMGHAFWLAFNSWRSKKATPAKVWLSSYGLAILLFTPWLPIFVVQYLNSVLPGIGQPINLATTSETASHLLLYQPSWQTRELLAMSVLILSVVLVFLLVRLWDKGGQKTRNNLLFISALTVVPFVALVVLNASSSSPFYISRYLAHFAIFYYMAIGFIIVSGFKFTPRFSALSAGIATIILVSGVINLATSGNFNFERQQKPAISQALAGTSCSDDLAFVAQDEYTYLDSWYYLRNCNLKFLKDGSVSERGGYAPLRGSTSQIQNINDVTTPRLVFISWKDTDNSTIFKDSNFKLMQTNIYQNHSIEIYQRQTSVE